MTYRNAAAQSGSGARRTTAKTVQPKPQEPRRSPQQQQRQSGLQKFTVSWGYRTLQRQGLKIFPRRLWDQEILNQAFQEAWAFDVGHEREYPESFSPPLGDYLLDLLRENVRARAEELLRQHRSR